MLLIGLIFHVIVANHLCLSLLNNGCDEISLFVFVFFFSSFQLKVDSLNGANYICRVVGLWGKIVVADSYHKVCSEIVLFLLTMCLSLSKASMRMGYNIEFNCVQ
jgi:hypothetical protein